MTFDPTADRGYHGRNDRKDEALAETNACDSAFDAQPKQESQQQRCERLRIAYNAALKRRISTGSIGSHTIMWAPTIVNRDRAFELQGRRTLIAALKDASYEELEMLERFVGNTQAMTELTQHGKLPPGLKDHYRHPIRAGGSPFDPANVCIMTVEAHDALREHRIYPALHSAYQDQWQAINHYANRRGHGNASRVDKLEMYAASAYAPGVRRLPTALVRQVEIGYPRETVVITDADFDLRDDLTALKMQAEQLRQRQPHRDDRANHRPAAPHARQARSTHRGGPAR